MPPVIITAAPDAFTVEANMRLRIIIYLLQFLLCLLYLHALPRASAIQRLDLPLRHKDVLELRPLPLAATAVTHQRRRRDSLTRLHNAIDALMDDNATPLRTPVMGTMDSTTTTATTTTMSLNITSALKSTSVVEVNNVGES